MRQVFTRKGQDRGTIGRAENPAGFRTLFQIRKAGDYHVPGKSITREDAKKLIDAERNRKP